VLTQALSREDGAAAAPEDGAGPARGLQTTPRRTKTDGRLSASGVGAGVDEEEEGEEDDEEEGGEVEDEEEVEALEQAVGDAAAARPSPAAGRPPGVGGGHQAQGDSPGGRRISGGGVPGDVADAAGADEDGAEASDGCNKTDDDHALPSSAGVPAAALAADQDVESECDDVGGDVDKMEAILWGPTGTYVKSPRVAHVRDFRVADVTTRNVAKDNVLHHYNAQQRSGYDWAFGSMVVCHDWMQTGSAVHDDLACGDGAASASAARAAAGADGSAGAAEGGNDGNGALPLQGPILLPFMMTDYQALDPVKKQLWMNGVAAAGGQGINHMDVNVHYPVVLIDGAHRLAAMKRPLDEKHEMAVEWILVAWGGRRDKQPMSHWDTLNLGAASNDLPAISISMTQLDHVVWPVNWVVTYNRLKPADERLRYVPGKTRPTGVSVLVKRAYDAGLVPMNKEGQPLGDDSLARIIKIALLNAVSPLTVECMVNYLADSQDSVRAGPRLSVETPVSNVLLNVNVGTDEENDLLRKLMLQISWKLTAGSSMERRHQNRGKQCKARRLTRGGDVTFFSCVWAFLTVVHDETKAATHRIFLANLAAAAQARAAQHGEEPPPVPPPSHVVGRLDDAGRADGAGRASGGAAPAASAAAAPVVVGVDTVLLSGAGGGTGGCGESVVGGVGGGDGSVGGVGRSTCAGHSRHHKPIQVGTPVVGPDTRARLTQDTTLWQVLIMRMPTTNPSVVTCLAFHLADLFVDKFAIERSHGFKKAAGGARGRTAVEIGRADPFALEHMPDWVSLVKSFVNPDQRRDQDSDCAGDRRGDTNRRRGRSAEPGRRQSHRDNVRDRTRRGAKASLMASGTNRERRHCRSLSVGGKDGRHGRGRSPSPLKEAAPSAPTTPKRVALRTVGRAGGKGRIAQQGGLSQDSGHLAGSQMQGGRGTGKVPDDAGGVARRPHPDHPEDIPPSLQEAASSTLQHAGTVDFPGFASLLPREHHGRDSIPDEDWKALEESVRHDMSGIGKATMPGAVEMAASRVRAAGGGGTSSRLPLGLQPGPAGEAEASILAEPVSAMQAGFAAVNLARS